MAKLMSYTDERGNTMPQSYWCIASAHIDRFSSTAELTFYGFKDQTTRGAWTPDSGIAPYIQKAYIGGDLYEQFFSETILATQNAIGQCYAAYAAVQGNFFDAHGATDLLG
jgi:hypothetical protein